MKPNHCFRLTMAAIMAAIPLAASAQTVFFTDTFATSTTNGLAIRTGTPTASATSYDAASTKNTIPGTNGVTIAPNDLHLALAVPTGSGFLEVQSIFATNGHPFGLSQANDYIDLVVVFTNSLGSMFNASSAPLWVGLYNSGGTLPATNLFNSGLNTTADPVAATNGAAGWLGYNASMNLSGGTSKLLTRPSQLAGTSSSDQDLVAGGFGGGAFTAQAATTLETLAAVSATLPTTSATTVELRITLWAPGVLMITNTLYTGAGTSGAVILTQGTTNVTGANLLATAFDGLAIGLGGKVATSDPLMDISSITISGLSSQPTPPTITAQPVPAVCATNGSCQFSVTAVGSSPSYQWYRGNVSLANAGEYSGATSPQLIISSAGTVDAGNYHCLITGLGGSTNSVTNSLTLDASRNLVWNGNNTLWDLVTNVSWNDNSNGGNPTNFNYGDSVTFDDTGAGNPNVTLAGTFLSAAKWLITGSTTYAFAGSGSFAGSGALIINSAASGNLEMNVANTHTGGTIISNSNPALNVYLQQYQVLVNGPLTLATPGMMEIVPTGSATVGVPGDTTVKDDFTVQFDGQGSFAGVFLGNLSVASGKTLTLTPSGTGLGATNRYRVYGTNVVVTGNIVLDGNSTPEANYNGTVLAPYAGSGSQTYNGVISGNGGIVQRGSSITYLNGANTYSGGTVPTSGNIAFGSDDNGSVGSIGSGPLLPAPEIPNATGSGTVLASGVAPGGTRTIANPIQYPTGTNNLTLIIGGTNNITFSGNIALQGQDGVSTASINSRIFQVTNTANTIFSGNISDAAPGYGITKTGPGNLYLNGGSSSYTGVTTNNSATSGNGAGLLAGTGTIPGSVFIQTNSAIGGGGPAGIGTLSISGSLTINGNGFFRVNHTGHASDLVSVPLAGGITNVGTGTITLTNVGAAVQTGDAFTLFSQGVTNGAAMRVVGAGMTWVNNLAVNGTVQVKGPLPPLFLTNSLSGTTLTLSWNPNYLGYTLQRQTNTLARGLGTNWVDVPNTANVTATNMTIVPTNPAVFYRLRP